MTRPRNITQTVDNAYFANVTPIWDRPKIVDNGLMLELWQHMPEQMKLTLATPEQRSASNVALKKALLTGGFAEGRINEIWIEEIDVCYHEAARELARWKPNVLGWNRDGWATHSDNIFFRVRMVLIDTCEAWRKYDWNVFDAEYHRIKEYWNTGPVWINEFQWRALPSELPKPATLIAICLADVIAQFGSVKSAPNNMLGSYKFEITEQTPWKAILEFVEVILSRDVGWDNIDIRSSVAHHSKNIERFYRTPNITC